MADNSTLPVSVGTEVFANDDISSVKYPRVKLTWGPDGTASDADVASGKPIPMQIRDSGGTSLTDSTGIKISTSQLGSLVNGSVPVVTGGFEYETVAVSQTDQIMGATGAVGDYLDCLLCVVATAATSQVQIKVGNGSAITVLPNAVGAGVGTYPIPIGLRCINATTPGWKITTAAGVTVLASGDFT